MCSGSVRWFYDHVCDKVELSHQTQSHPPLPTYISVEKRSRIIALTFLGRHGCHKFFFLIRKKEKCVIDLERAHKIE